MVTEFELDGSASVAVIDGTEFTFPGTATALCAEEQAAVAALPAGEKSQRIIVAGINSDTRDLVVLTGSGKLLTVSAAKHLTSTDEARPVDCGRCVRIGAAVDLSASWILDNAEDMGVSFG